MKDGKKNTNGKTEGLKPPSSPDQSAGESKFPWLLLILLLATLLRIAVHISASANDPSYGHVRQDELTYNSWATSFSRSEQPSPLPFAAPPFYSFVLGNTVYRLFGPNIIAAYIFNSLLALVSIYLLFLIGRKAWDYRAGLVAAVAYNFYSPFIMLELKIMATTLYITLCLLSFYWAMLARDRERPWGYLTAGLIMGLATITRPTFVLFIPFYILWLLLSIRPFKSFILPALLAIIGFILPIIPITATNFTGGRDFIPLTTTGGVNLYMGNYEGATGYYHSPPGIDAIDLQTLHKTSKQAAEADTGRTMKPSEVSSYYQKKALNFIRTQPLKWLKIEYWKFRALVNNFEVGDVWDYYTTRQLIPLLYWFGLPFGLLAALGAIGLIWTFAANRRTPLLGLAFISFVVYMLAFFISTRFRVPLAAMCCLFIGGGVSAKLGTGLIQRASGTVSEDIRIRPVPNLAFRFWAGIIIGAVILILSFTKMGWFPEGTRIHGEHYNLGLIYYGRGEMQKARDEFLAELEGNPMDARSYADLALVQLKLGDKTEADSNMLKALELGADTVQVQSTYGLYLLETNNLQDAAQAFRKALAIDPADPVAAYHLADILFRTGNSKEALGIAEKIPIEESSAQSVLLLIGNIQLDLGQPDKAEASIRRALSYNIQSPDAWFYLGMALKAKGDYSAALGSFSKAGEIRPDFPGLQLAIGDALYAQADYVKARDAYIQGLKISSESFELYHNLGLAYSRLGDANAAIDSFLKAIELKPDYYQAFYNLANLYLAQKKLTEAITGLERAIEIKPDFAPALLNLGSIYAQLKNYEKAREYWQRVINLAPSSDEATIAQNNLKALGGGK